MNQKLCTILCGGVDDINDNQDNDDDDDDTGE